MASITARRTTAIRLRVLARQSQRAGWNTLARFVAGLLVLLVALDLLVAATVNRLIAADPNGEGSSPPWRLALYDRAPRPDVLLLGSSRVQTGLNPTILRETVAPELGTSPQILNMGLVWGTPQVNYWLLKNWIRPDKQPSLIVYGASEYEFNAHSSLVVDYDAEYLATLSDYREAYPDPTQHLDKQFSFVLAQFWQLYRYRSVLHDTLTDLAQTGWQPTGQVEDADGFLAVDHVMGQRDIDYDLPRFTGASSFYSDYTVQGYQAARFEALLQLAQARGIRVVVVNMPITTIQQQLLPPAAYASYRAYLQQTAAKYGAAYYDYNDHALFTEPGDFLDPHHLNQFGAEKLSRRVGTEALLPALRQH